jgi:hypothetical protein
VETFDRIVVPAPAPGRGGFSGKDIAWMLAHGPGEILVLRPAPDDLPDNARDTASPVD